MRQVFAWSVKPTAVVAWLHKRDLDTRSYMLLLMRRGHTQESCVCRSYGHDASRLEHALNCGIASRSTCICVSMTGRGSGSTLHAPTKATSTTSDPNQRRHEAGPGRRRPSGGHHVAHHQIPDKSRLSHRLKEGCMYADFSMMFAGLQQTRRTARGKLAMSVTHAWHLNLRVLEIIPTHNAFVPCARDNQRSLLRR